MDKPKISVIVPAYNAEKYITNCLDSIIGQTYENIEVIVVDDGSVDNTKNIIKEYAQKNNNIKPVYQANQGVTGARINGINQASGDWIGFVDSDDEIETNMYELLINNAINYDADISHCGYQMIFLDGRINYFHNTKCIVEQDTINGLKDLLEGSLIEPGLWNKLFKKSLLNDLLNSNVIDTSIKINEDLLMNYYLFKYSKKSIYQDECKYHYLVREESATRIELNEHRIYDPIKVKNIIKEDAPDELEDLTTKLYLRTCMDIYNSIMLSNKSFKKERIYIKQILLNNQHDTKLLTKRNLLFYYMILHMPYFLYKYIYKIYVGIVQKNPYE